MIRGTTIIIGVLLTILCMNAQENRGSRLLVFRNTGEINSFVSDSLQHVVLSTFDKDSVEHEEFVSQIFYFKNNTSLVIPLSEIDSVAFGERKIVEAKKNVRKLTDNEVLAISEFDGETITFDSRLLLHAGEVVYYDKITDILPYALCCRIEDIEESVDNNKAQILFLDPAEVFDRYLVTGEEANTIATFRSPATGADSDKAIGFKFEKSDIGGFSLSGNIELPISLNVENIVLDFVKHYYHSTIIFSTEPKCVLKLLSNEKEFSYVKTPLNKAIPFMYGLLHADLCFGFFLDANAEVGLEYESAIKLSYTAEWTRKNGKDTFTFITDTDGNSLAESKMREEVHLSGELFLGGLLDLSLNTAFDIVGCGIETKAGPKMSGELSLGLLEELTSADGFNADAYAKGNLNLSVDAKLQPYVYTRNPFSDKIQRTDLTSFGELSIDCGTLNLFPEFHTKAVMTRLQSGIVQSSSAEDAVSVSTYVETPISYPQEISFEVVKTESGASLGAVVADGLIEENQLEAQNLNAVIPIGPGSGDIKHEEIVVRPVFDYKGYKIKAKPINVAGDMVLTPMIANMVGHSNYFVSGMTPVSQHNYDETTYIEGNLIGLTYGDPRHKDRTFSTIEFVNLEDLDDDTYIHPLIGVWSGVIEQERVSIAFFDNENGEYNGEKFSYKYNSPLRGGISIKLSNGSTISFSIIELTDTEMRIKMKGYNTIYTLIKE